MIEEVKTNQSPYLYNSSLFQTEKSESDLNHGILQKLSINLPRIAFITKNETRFVQELRHKFAFCAEILNKKYNIIQKRLSTNHLPLCNSNIDGKKLFQLNKQDLCIGFIGLNEAISILTESPMQESSDSFNLGLRIVGEMHRFCGELSKRYDKSYCLIEDTSKRAIERFIKLDKRHFPQIPMDSYHTSAEFGENIEIDLFKRLKMQGQFHEFIAHGATETVPFIQLKSRYDTHSSMLEFFSQIWNETKIKCLTFKK
jgi:ribonucleoside-triphosphate reductase